MPIVSIPIADKSRMFVGVSGFFWPVVKGAYTLSADNLRYMK